jgi:hypothetical protein
MLKAFHTVLFLFTISLTSLGQQSSTAANSDPTYKQLREITIGSESFALKDFVLKRDAGTFTFRSGNLTFLSAVNGKITGAIFAGDAIFSLAPPLGTESRMISMLSKDNGKEFVETFQEALFRFTDNTYDEIKQRATPANGVSTKLETLQKYQDYSRKTIRYNYDARILQDVLSAVPGGFFVAFINGQKYSSKLVYTIDPHGADDVAPEEVSLRTFDDMKYGIWSAFHFSNEYAKGVATGTEENSAYSIVHQDLDTAIDKNGYLRGNSLASIVSNSDSLRAVDFALFAKLRVKTVTDADGNPLSFIQEDDKHDYNYWVLLPKPLAKGEKTQIRTIYEGKDAVLDMGQGNYFPVARSTWYPNMTTMMHYATYDMKFSVPRNVQVVATGNLVNQSVVGDHAISQWKTQVPEAVAGFNLGEFKRLEAKVDRDGYTVESYANENQPNNVAALSLYHMNIGSMDTRNMMKKPLAEAQLAMDLYSYYFGPIAYKRGP